MIGIFFTWYTLDKFKFTVIPLSVASNDSEEILREEGNEESAPCKNCLKKKKKKIGCWDIGWGSANTFCISIPFFCIWREIWGGRRVANKIPKSVEKII